MNRNGLLRNGLLPCVCAIALYTRIRNGATEVSTAGRYIGTLSHWVSNVAARDPAPRGGQTAESRSDGSQALGIHYLLTQTDHCRPQSTNVDWNRRFLAEVANIDTTCRRPDPTSAAPTRRSQINDCTGRCFGIRTLRSLKVCPFIDACPMVGNLG